MTSSAISLDCRNPAGVVQTEVKHDTRPSRCLRSWVWLRQTRTALSIDLLSLPLANSRHPLHSEPGRVCQLLHNISITLYVTVCCLIDQSAPKTHGFSILDGDTQLTCKHYHRLHSHTQHTDIHCLIISRCRQSECALISSSVSLG